MSIFKTIIQNTTQRDLKGEDSEAENKAGGDQRMFK